MENKPAVVSNNPTGKNGGKHKAPEYAPEVYDEQAKNFAMLGYSAKDLSDALFISHTTFKRWIKEHPTFRASLFEGREQADGKVAAALYKAAVGYTLNQQRVVVTKDGDIHVVNFKEEVGPNHVAALNWLKNRQPDLWSDKTQLEHSGVMVVTMDLNGGDAGGDGVEDIDFDDLPEEEAGDDE